jgi:hypothetical protein
MAITIDVDARYQAIPLYLSPERDHILDRILSEMVRFETMFTDYQKEDDTRKAAVAASLTKLDSFTWEVWELENQLPIDLVGILHLSQIVPGQDAVAHYVFFDGDLRSKTSLLQRVLDWVFVDHPEVGWSGLQRLTLHIPAYAHALARHAQKYLGFSGPFTYKTGGKTLKVEGVKRQAILWRGEPADLLLMGKLNADS